MADEKPMWLWIQMDSDFEAMRLNWYRVSTSLNAQQSGIKPQVAEQLNAAMSRILTHSRNVDRIKAQVKKNASLYELFWYRQILLDEVLRRSLSAQTGQPKHCMSLVRLLHQGLHNVHRFCPEEQLQIGSLAVAHAELFFSQIISACKSFSL